jgi:hypothetical protein
VPNDDELGEFEKKLKDARDQFAVRVLHQQNPTLFFDFFDFLALFWVIIKSKVVKVEK